jgi:predicted amidohydrolase
MARYVKISTIGSAPQWLPESVPDRDAWAKIRNYLSSHAEPVLPDRPDLILFSETADMPAGWSIKRRDAFMADRGDANMEFFSNMAKENRCNVAFSTIRKGKGDFCLNSMYILDRDGREAGCYDKNHLSATELAMNVRCGLKADLISLDIGKVACAICFDLNFEELRRIYKAAKPEVILFSSACHSGVMQQYWAQTCRSYLVSSISGSRPSAILSPMGETLAYNTNHFSFATAVINLDYAIIHYDYNIQKFTAIKKNYGPEVSIIDPGNLGYFMIASESDKFSAADILAEYEMITYDEYLEQTLIMRNNPEHRNCE